MGVVTKVHEKVVEINWETQAAPLGAFESFSQSFWPKKSKVWDYWGSKRDIFLAKQLGILSCWYSGSGLANETFPILVDGWIFLLFL